MPLIILATLLCAGFCGQITVNFEFDETAIQFQYDGEYYHLMADDCIPYGEPGDPEILAKSAHILLPPGTMAREIVVEDAQYVPLADGILLAPFQPQAIRPMPGHVCIPKFVMPDLQKYSSDNFFPENPAMLSTDGVLSGYSIAGIVIFPVRYNPSQGKIEALTRVTISVIYEETAPILPARRSPMSEIFSERMAERLVQNPQEIVSYSGAWAIDPGAKDYLIVCRSSLALSSDMQRFRLCIRRQGWNDTILTVESVSSFAGVDLAEKLRNAIKQIYMSCGISVVALIGDVELVPHRYAFAMDCEAGFYPDENDIPCDMYFSALDGNWNANGFLPFGETTDNVDLYPDVIVGRISVHNEEFGDWVDKYVRYVESPPAHFGNKALFLAEVLWEDPFTDSGIGKDMIRDESLPTFFNLTRLYETFGNENLSSVMAALNDGFNVINHDGHANYIVMGAGTDYMTISDVDVLFNFPRCGVLYSIGCWPAAFDYDCVAEHFVKNPMGGTVAFVGNSRYGWGSPGNPGYGYSDYYDRTFWANIFGDFPSVGMALAAMKVRYAPFSVWENVWRWKEFEVNVLGEPAMIVWRSDPEFATFDLPSSIDIAGGNLSVSVPNLSSVVAIQEGEILSRAIGTGMISIWVDPLLGLPVEISVFELSGHKRMFIDTIYVEFDGPYIAIEYISPSELTINETTDVRVVIRNVGSTECLARWSPEITSGGILIGGGTDSAAISSMDTACIELSILPDAGARDGDYVYGVMNCTCESGTFPMPFAIEIVRPELSVKRINLYGGHRGNAALPGRSYLLSALVKNFGSFRFAQNLDIYSLSEFASIDTFVFADVEANDSIYTEPIPFIVSVSCPERYSLPVAFDFGDGTIDTFWISVGCGGFWDDAESDPMFSLTMPWHITNEEFHSAGNSYRCANPSGFYPNNCDVSMISDNFVIGENAVLSFWMRYDVPNYGSDGIYISAYCPSLDSVVLLDYVGSGGALPVLGFEVGWTEWKYRIPFPPNSDMQIIFRFCSDNLDNDRGFFIDDISVSWQPTFVDTSTGIDVNVPSAKRISLSAMPNPFNEAVKICVENVSEKSVDILDLNGRIVAKFGLLPGRNEFVWSPIGCGTGIYFIRLGTSGNGIVKSIVYIK